MVMVQVKFEFDSNIKFVDSSDGIATYTIMKDNFEYDEECVIKLKLTFREANRLAMLFDEVVALSKEDAYNTLLEKFQNFIGS